MVSDGVELHRRDNSGTPPSGLYSCDIPTGVTRRRTDFGAIVDQCACVQIASTHARAGLRGVRAYSTPERVALSQFWPALLSSLVMSDIVKSNNCKFSLGSKLQVCCVCVGLSYNAELHFAAKKYHVECRTVALTKALLNVFH